MDDYRVLFNKDVLGRRVQLIYWGLSEWWQLVPNWGKFHEIFRWLDIGGFELRVFLHNNRRFV